MAPVLGRGLGGAAGAMGERGCAMAQAMGGAGLRPARSRDASPRAARSRGRRRTGPSGVTRMRRDGGGRTPCSRPLASAGGTPEAHRHGPTTGTTVGPPAAQAVPAIPEPCARCRQSGRRRCHRPVYSGEPPGSETCLLRPDRQRRRKVDPPAVPPRPAARRTGPDTPRRRRPRLPRRAHAAGAGLRIASRAGGLRRFGRSRSAVKSVRFSR